ncbi:EamA family transporter [Rhodoferax koreense]|uniref:EamA family transporter n=1 Tax=Rhodoferax koreensis TaxID=1842727 RepID=A0A1P8JS26_9BURK|nr:EamA family transporter [Rhodoferax koreense]APW36567.1 EamA family transporter [Rhodoferax koreense]
MKRFYAIGFLLLMAFDTLAQLSFKFAGAQALPLEFSPAWLLRVFGQPWIYGAFVGYMGAFFTWMTLLKHAPIGPAFAASHLEIISVLLLSSWLFGEHIGWAQALGGLFILAGIVCLAFSEEEAPGAAEPTLRTAAMADEPAR